MNEEKKEKKESIEIMDPNFSVVHEGEKKRSLSLLDMSIEDAKAFIEKRVELSAHMRAVAIAKTIKGDWDDMGGNPYCNDKGIARIVSSLGISYEPIWQTETIGEDENGKYYIIISKVRAWHPWFEEQSNLGVSSERDPFFAKRKDGTWKKRIEIPKPNIMKKSVTNGLGICIRKMLALNGMSWDDPLIKEKKGATVNYSKGEKKENQNSNEEKKEPANHEEKNKIHEGILDWCNNDKEKYSMIVFEIAGGFKKLNDVQKITTQKWLDEFTKKMKSKKLDEWYSLAMKRREENQGELPF